MTRQEILDLILSKITSTNAREVTASRLREVLQALNDSAVNAEDDDVLTSEDLPPGALPGGGTTNQVLKKTSNNDYEVQWADDNSGTTITETAQATIESPINTEADKFVSARRWWQGIAYFLTQSWTWTLKQIFTVAPRFSSMTASRLIRVDANKDIADVTVRNGIGLDASGNLELGGLLTKFTEIDGNFGLNLGGNTALLNFIVRASNNLSLEGNIQAFKDSFKSLQINNTETRLLWGTSGTQSSILFLDTDEATLFTNNAGSTTSISLKKNTGTIEIFAGGRFYILNTNGIVEQSDFSASYVNGSLVRKSYVDSLLQGIKTKAPVAVLSITNLTLSGLQTLQGVTGVAGLRVAVTGQTTASQNGIYEMQSGAWNRSPDADIASELISATFLVEGGTYANTTWRVSTTSITIGSTNISIVQVQGTIASATETSAGIAELLTQAEAEAGTDNERIATILRVSQWFQTKSNAANGYIGFDANRQVYLHRATVPSASTINLDGSSGNVLEVSGVVTVNTIEAPAQTTFLVIIPTGTFKIGTSGNIKTLKNQEIQMIVGEPLHLIWNSTTSQWLQLSWYSTQFKKTSGFGFGSDFITSDANDHLPLSANNGGTTGSATYTKSVAGRLGIVTLNTDVANVSATGRHRFGLGSSGGNATAFAFGGAFGFWANACVRIPILSDASNTFTDWFAFNDSQTADGTDCLHFKYSHGVNSGKWQILSKKAGVIVQTIDTGVTVVADTFYDLYVEVNAAGDLALFYINGVLVATITGTANIPNGTGEAMGLYILHNKSVGGANRELDIDYFFGDKI